VAAIDPTPWGGYTTTWQELRAHRELVQAIKTRDAGRARAAMRAHMASTDQCLTIALAAEQHIENAERKQVQR
jgi:DNA-binding FadR family transcriptional regulator